MPLTLSKIANNVASVTLRYGDDSVTVDYYPSKITEKTFAQLQVFSNADETNVAESFGSLNEMLVSVLKDWDVYEDDAQTIMFPIDADRLAELPIAFRVAVLSAVMGDIRPETMALQPK